MSDTILGLLITAGGGLLGVVIKELFALRRDVQEYHKQVNGHMANLLKLTKKDGVREGKDEQKEIDKS